MLLWLWNLHHKWQSNITWVICNTHENINDTNNDFENTSSFVRSRYRSQNNVYVIQYQTKICGSKINQDLCNVKSKFMLLNVKTKSMLFDVKTKFIQNQTKIYVIQSSNSERKISLL